MLIVSSPEHLAVCFCSHAAAAAVCVQCVLVVMLSLVTIIVIFLCLLCGTVLPSCSWFVLHWNENSRLSIHNWAFMSWIDVLTTLPPWLVAVVLESGVSSRGFVGFKDVNINIVLQHFFSCDIGFLGNSCFCHFLDSTGFLHLMFSEALDKHLDSKHGLYVSLLYYYSYHRRI